MIFFRKVIFAVLFVLTLVGFVNHAMSDNDQQWILRNYWPVLEELLPAKEHPGMWIAYRSSGGPNPEKPEYMFMLTDAGSLVGVVRVADGNSIEQQLWNLHREKPEAGGSDLQSQVKIQEYNLDERNCPAMRRHWESAPNTLHRLPTRDKGILHGTNHELFVAFGAGRAELAIFEGDHPLVLWALETRAVLQECIESGRMKTFNPRSGEEPSN